MKDLLYVRYGIHDFFIFFAHTVGKSSRLLVAFDVELIIFVRVRWSGSVKFDMEGEFFVSILMEFIFVGIDFFMFESFESKYSTNLFAVDAGEPQVL